MQLPTVSGANLIRQKMTFPADFTAELNLVFIAFQRWQQSHVDTWVPLVEDLSQRVPDFDYFEFPTIQNMNMLARRFINSGMRAGIQDQDVRARTVTLYLEKENFKRSLGITEEGCIWTFLFDKSGRVLWNATGPFTAEKGQSLTDLLSELTILAPSS